MSCTLRTKQTVFCPTYLIAAKGRKGMWSKKSFIGLKVCRGVSRRSDAVRRLPASVPHQQYYCALSAHTASVQLTSLNMRHTTFRFSDVRWMRFHPVLPASPVMTAQLDAAATLTAFSRDTIFADFDFWVLNFSWLPILITCHQTFVTGSDQSGPVVFPLATAICKQRPVFCPRCSERHTASVVFRILCFKMCLHFIQYIFSFYCTV